MHIRRRHGYREDWPGGEMVVVVGRKAGAKEYPIIDMQIVLPTTAPPTPRAGCICLSAGPHAETSFYTPLSQSLSVHPSHPLTQSIAKRGITGQLARRRSFYNTASPPPPTPFAICLVFTQLLLFVYGSGTIGQCTHTQPFRPCAYICI